MITIRLLIQLYSLSHGEGRGEASPLLFLVVNDSHHRLSHSLEGIPVNVVHIIFDCVPCRIERIFSFRVTRDDVDRLDSGNFVNEQVVVCSPPHYFIDEIFPVSQFVSLFPDFPVDVFGIFFRIGFAIESRLLAAYHVEQYAETGVIPRHMRITCPVL